MNIATLDLNNTSTKLKVLQMCYMQHISNYEDFCLTLPVFRKFISMSTSGKDIYLKDEVDSPLVYLLKMLQRYRIRPTNIIVVKTIKKITPPCAGSITNFFSLHQKSFVAKPAHPPNKKQMHE